MITRSTQVVGPVVRLRRDRFIALLSASPAAAEAGPGYDAVVSKGVDPLFALAVFNHESTLGTRGVTPKYDTKNPGNCRTKATSDGTVIDTNAPQWVGGVQLPPSNRGSFVKHTSWTEGWRNLAARLTHSGYPYVQQGATTIESIIPIWAPAADSNSPENYIAAVVADMNRWEDQVILQGMPPMVDLRSALPTRPLGGPNQSQPNKTGVIVHYSGPSIDWSRDPVKVIQAEANYHVNKDWGGGAVGDGYMYHVVIDWNGTIYLTRDLPAVLWHCGSWPENADSFSVHLLLGGSQRATPEMLASTRRVLDWMRIHWRIDRLQVKGHKEVSPTACPGTLMEDLVLPYRSEVVTLPVEGDIKFDDCPYIVGGGFSTYIRRIPQDLWLPTFGLPEENETTRTINGFDRTTQKFERAMLAWYPEGTPDGVPADNPFHVRVLKLDEIP